MKWMKEELSVSKLPKEGMNYEQAIRTAVRHGREGNAPLVNSMINQVKLAEGNKSAREFSKEVIAKAQGK